MRVKKVGAREIMADASSTGNCSAVLQARNHGPFLLETALLSLKLAIMAYYSFMAGKVANLSSSRWYYIMLPSLVVYAHPTPAATSSSATCSGDVHATSGQLIWADPAGSYCPFLCSAVHHLKWLLDRAQSGSLGFSVQPLKYAMQSLAFATIICHI